MDTLHHAYIVFGKGERVDSFLNKISTEITGQFSVKIENVVFEFEQISVENVEEISRAMRILPTTGSARLVIVNGRGIGTSAQHALLKTLEEPIAGSYICIVLSHEIPLMPTVTSRVRVVKVDSDNLEDSNGVEVKKFFKSTQAERLLIAKDLLAQYDKEKLGKSDVINFLEDLIKEYKSNFKGSNEDPRLKSVLLVETYMRDTNASLKQCLELLALAL